MSLLDNIDAEINKRAAELVLPRFLALGSARHAKVGFKTGCECTYCHAKRKATSEIGHVAAPNLVPSFFQLDYLDRKFYQREIIRDNLRTKHRARLRELYNE